MPLLSYNCLSYNCFSHWPVFVCLSVHAHSVIHEGPITTAMEKNYHNSRFLLSPFCSSPRVFASFHSSTWFWNVNVCRILAIFLALRTLTSMFTVSDVINTLLPPLSMSFIPTLGSRSVLLTLHLQLLPATLSTFKNFETLKYIL